MTSPAGGDARLHLHVVALTVTAALSSELETAPELQPAPVAAHCELDGLHWTGCTETGPGFSYALGIKLLLRRQS
jgi:hypothetical protein